MTSSGVLILTLMVTSVQAKDDVVELDTCGYHVFSG